MIRLHRNLIAIAEVYSRGSDKSRLHVWQIQARNNIQEQEIGWKISVEEMQFTRRKKFLKEEAAPQTEDHNCQV